MLPCVTMALGKANVDLGVLATFNQSVVHKLAERYGSEVMTVRQGFLAARHHGHTLDKKLVKQIYQLDLAFKVLRHSTKSRLVSLLAALDRELGTCTARPGPCQAEKQSDIGDLTEKIDLVLQGVSLLAAHATSSLSAAAPPFASGGADGTACAAAHPVCDDGRIADSFFRCRHCLGARGPRGVRRSLLPRKSRGHGVDVEQGPVEG